MALKPEQRIFIKHYLKSGDHIASYIKAVPGTDRKKAATCGKRWLKNQEISAEIAKHKPQRTPSIDEINNFQSTGQSEGKELTPQIKRFCEEYLVDLNGTKAAIRAKYSERSASEQAYDLLRKPQVQDYIQQLQLARSRRTEITVDNVLYELACIAFAKVTDFVRVETKTQEEYHPFASKEDDEDDDISGETITTSYRAVDVFETDGIPEDKIRALASIKMGRNGIEVKLNSKEKALELIGRHLGMWNDKLQVNAEEELKQLLKKVMGGAE
ncbi:terminase small subunit [Chitinophaga sp. RCC_12]